MILQFFRRMSYVNCKNPSTGERWEQQVAHDYLTSSNIGAIITTQGVLWLLLLLVSQLCYSVVSSSIMAADKGLNTTNYHRPLASVNATLSASKQSTTCISAHMLLTVYQYQWPWDNRKHWPDQVEHHGLDTGLSQVFRASFCVVV